MAKRAGRVACIEEIINAYENFDLISLGKEPIRGD
jgi:hypothetical protein